MIKDIISLILIVPVFAIVMLYGGIVWVLESFGVNV